VLYTSLILHYLIQLIKKVYVFMTLHGINELVGVVSHKIHFYILFYLYYTFIFNFHSL